MQKEFSLRRTRLLIRGQWADRSKMYLYGTLGLLGLITIVMFWWVKFSNGYREESLLSFYFVGLLGVCALASNSFNILKNKPGAVHWLMLPATASEKLVSILFYNFLNAIIYTVCFVLVAGITLWYLRENGVNLFVKDSKDMEKLRDVFYAFLAVQSFYILGAVYFKKNALGFTTIIGVLFVMLFVYYLNKISGWLGTNITFLGNQLEHYSGNKIETFTVDSAFISVMLFLFKIIWAPFFWLITWLRIKEKQI